ncbi:2-hydroxyacid dehydrogenase [Virgisporangium aurantiacum]|uniref:2-hydroxyacid dehydrogenase n=1 Tax=Virgisporangium aurantiacum TaxID=175570 RepID=UPI00194E7CFB|nr:2-hydroxyacid dehydrogenase [Virgisporangium aurantiacum]
MRVWVPYSGVVGRLPAGLSVDVYDSGDEPPDTLDEVEFYVAPYTFDLAPLELIKRMPALRVVQTQTAGFEHVLPYLPDGVTLCNAGGVHDTSTAELAVTLMLASLRGIPSFVQGRDQQDWRFGWYDALADRTVLLVGYGGIGKAVDQRLAGFEVDVLRVARSARDGVAEMADLPRLLPRADVVVLCVPLTADTRGLVDAEFLGRMRDGALLVNVSRGPVVDTDALLAELSGGRLRAAVDVTDPEPPPAGHPLWTVPGLLMSPHVGGSSSAFRPRVEKVIVDQVRRFAAGEPLRYVVRD